MLNHNINIHISLSSPISDVIYNVVTK